MNLDKNISWKIIVAMALIYSTGLSKENYLPYKIKMYLIRNKLKFSEPPSQMKNVNYLCESDSIYNKKLHLIEDLNGDDIKDFAGVLRIASRILKSKTGVPVKRLFFLMVYSSSEGFKHAFLQEIGYVDSLNVTIEKVGPGNYDGISSYSGYADDGGYKGVHTVKLHHTGVKYIDKESSIIYYLEGNRIKFIMTKSCITYNNDVVPDFILPKSSTLDSLDLK
jgi:hypothetical protein